MHRVAFGFMALLVTAMSVDAKADVVLVGNSEVTPVDIRFDKAPEIASSDELVITGTNGNPGPAALGLRIEDAESNDDWVDRVDREVAFPPGRFQFVVPATEWQTVSGRQLILGKITRIAVFTEIGGSKLSIDRVAIEGTFEEPAVREPRSHGASGPLQ